MKARKYPAFKFHTVEEIAKIMRVGPETIRRWIRAKKLPAAKGTGRQWLISTLDIPSYKREEIPE